MNFTGDDVDTVGEQRAGVEDVRGVQRVLAGGGGEGVEEDCASRQIRAAEDLRAVEVNHASIIADQVQGETAERRRVRKRGRPPEIESDVGEASHTVGPANNRRLDP